MKKLLLAGTAIAGFAMFATPAMADGLKLDLSGFYRGYGAFADSDETGTAAAGDDFRDFDFRSDSEIHFTGETVLDNGLTVGVHSEVDLADDATTNDTDESYVYFSGNWGRVNFGEEDGAQYLLQVAAPSADSNVDGLRTRIQAYSFDLAGNLPAGVSSIADYGMDMGRNAAKLTYFTPKFNGFQGGISFAPEVTDGQKAVFNGTTALAADDNPGHLENLWELAARWDGEFNGVGLSLGAGYGHASTEEDAAAGAVNADDRTQWNIASTATFQQFSFGVSYSEDDYGHDEGAFGDGETTWVVGAGWDNGPYHLGVSWFNSEFERAANDDFEIDRFTFGGTYAYGPGMTFRGAVSFGEIDDTIAAPSTSRDFTQVTIGTEVNF